MDSIVMIEGNVKYKITLDPSVWIFDDRKIDLKQYFQNEQLENQLGITFKPFIENASPDEDVTVMMIETSLGEIVEVLINEAYDSILCFAKNGKPLKEDGPLYFYWGDGSNINEPITNIRRFYFK